MSGNSRLKKRLSAAVSYIENDQVSECRLYECYGVLCCVVSDLAEHMQDTASQGRNLRLISADAAQRWARLNVLSLTENLSSALQVAFDGFPGPLAAKSEYREYFCADVVKLRKAITAIDTLLNFFYSDAYKLQLEDVEAKRAICAQLETLSTDAPKTYITPREYMDKQGDRRYTHMNRVRMLWEQVAFEDLDWEEKALRSMNCRSIDSAKLASYAKQVCLIAGRGTSILGFNNAGFFTDSLSKASVEGREILRVRPDAFTYALHTRGNFRDVACCLALADMPMGASIDEFSRHVRRVCYLMCNMYGRRDGINTRNLAVGFAAAMSFDDTAPGPYIPKNGELRGTLSLVDVITIERPQFEQYRDKRHRGLSTFDYVTVDITLVTTYGAQAMDLVKKNVGLLKELIMDRVRAAPRLREKKLLADLLYVKELQAAHNSLITAWVEFKPGAEEAINAAYSEANKGASPMNLQ